MTRTKYPNPYAGRPDGHNPADDEPTPCERGEHEWRSFQPVEKFDPKTGDLMDTAEEVRDCEFCDATERRVRVGCGCTGHWKYIED